MNNLRLKILSYLIRLHYWTEWCLELQPHHKQHKPIFWDPGTILISLVISAISFAATTGISYLTRPKPKAAPNGRSVEIQLTDSMWGVDKMRIYGGSPSAGDSIGGMEVGGNVIWMSEVRKIRTPVQGGGGQGGKGGGGGGGGQQQFQDNYKVDVAVAVGEGPLRLLRVKLNEDIIYDLTGPVIPPEALDTYEAEDAALSEGAVRVDDSDFSGGRGVTALNGTGAVNFTVVGGSEGPYPIEIAYKCSSDTTVEVEVNGATSVYTLAAAEDFVGFRSILKLLTLAESTIIIRNASNADLKIDAIYIDEPIFVEPEGPPEFPRYARPTGVFDANFSTLIEQDNLLLPDPLGFDTSMFEARNAKPSQPDSGVVSIDLPNNAHLAWYQGTEDQPVDAVIAGVLGAASTPAFRGTAFGRFFNIDITKYLPFPNTRWLVENIETKTISEICLKVALAAGLEAIDLDLSIADDMPVRGYVINAIEAPAKTFEQMALLGNLSFVETGSGQIKAIDLSDRTPVAEIRAADLGAYVADEEDIPPTDDVVSSLIDPSIDLIRTLELQFFNPAATTDYGTDRAVFNNPYTSSNRKETKSLNCLLKKEEAERITRREVQRNQLKTAPVAFKIPHKFAGLEAGECFELEIEGEMKLHRLEEKTGAAPGVFECTASNEDVFVVADDISTAPVSRLPLAVAFPARTVGTIMDIPALRDAEKGIDGVHVAACPARSDFGAWTSATVYRTKAVGYQQVKVLTKPALMGRVVEVLEDAPGGLGFGEIDVISSVTADFYGIAVPTSVTEAQAEDGANACVVGSEVTCIRTWTRVNDYPNRWIGTNIIRRQKHTEKFSGVHQAGERIVFLTDAVKFIPLDAEDASVERTWKFVTNGSDIDEAAPIAFTWEALNRFNEEAMIPVIGQITTSTYATAKLGVSNYTRAAQYRRVEVASEADMSGEYEATIYSADEFPHSVLPPEFVLNRTDISNAFEQSRFVRVSHSSNGVDFTEPSNILEVIFADISGASGSAGGFDPNPDYEIDAV